MSLILVCCRLLFGYEFIGTCENKRAEPGRSEFISMSMPVSLTSMSKTSRITSKLRQSDHLDFENAALFQALMFGLLKTGDGDREGYQRPCILVNCRHLWTKKMFV